VIKEFLVHYHQARPHQGLGRPSGSSCAGLVKCGCQDDCQTSVGMGLSQRSAGLNELGNLVRLEGIEPPALRSGAARSVR
jgi:hypothetical protein